MLLPLSTAQTLTLARERACAELRYAVGFAVENSGFFFPAEFVDEASWNILCIQKPVLILSPARAQMLGFAGTETAIATEGFSLADLWNAIAGKNPPALLAQQAPLESPHILALGKQAGIIPAVLWFKDFAASDDDVMLSQEALFYYPAADVIQGASATLPLEGAENTSITSFRMRHGSAVHLALIIGDVSSKASPLVRVHSSCVTGDLLGSLRCDCGDQLRMALEAMKTEGAGILLYLNQEGRDIGITNKLRAYALQEQGMDTFAANQMLGFEEDERDFGVAAAMLKMLGHARIRLLTNNPDKIAAFDATGITILERLPLLAGSNSHNHAYIEAKKTKRGHFS